MTLFKNKYRIESARLPGYDYSQYGAYFVTIVTHNRENFFGEIVNGKMLLNEIGKIVLHCWNDLPNHYENIILDEFVIMPNHVHGIIIITDKTDCNTRIPHETAENITVADPAVETGLRPVSTGPVSTGPVSTEPVSTEPVSTEPVSTEPVSTEPVSTELVSTEPVSTRPVSTSTTTKKQKRHGLSEFVRAFKSFSSRRINQLRKTPSQIWQSRFYDHVIRDENELNRIREYIINNPLQWELDNENQGTFKHRTHGLRDRSE